MHDQAVENRHTLLIPVHLKHVPISNLLEDENIKMPSYQSEDGFIEMVHVAFKLRSDIMAHHQYKGLNICEDEAISCIPDSVFMFVRLMQGGQSLLVGDFTESDDHINGYDK